MDLKPATKSNRLYASDPHVCLNGAIAPSELVDLMRGRELTNGFANRFLTVWAERTHWLLPMIEAAKNNLGELPELALADAGYRSEDNLKSAPIELIVALGREGKEHARGDAVRHPHTAAMADKLKTEQGQAAYRKREWIAEHPNGWIKNVLGLRQFSMQGLQKVRAKFKLVCMALNLRRMAALAR